MSWLAILAGVIALLRALVEYLHGRNKIDAALSELLLRSNREALDAIEQARKARERMRIDLERAPDGVMSDDGFRRND